MSKHNHRTHNRHINQPYKCIPDHQVNRLACIGAFVRGMRLADGFSQIEAAQEIGIAKSTIQAAEHGGNITLLTIFKIIDAFDMTLHEFFTEMQ